MITCLNAQPAQARLCTRCWQFHAHIVCWLYCADSNAASCLRCRVVQSSANCNTLQPECMCCGLQAASVQHAPTRSVPCLVLQHQVRSKHDSYLCLMLEDQAQHAACKGRMYQCSLQLQLKTLTLLIVCLASAELM